MDYYGLQTAVSAAAPLASGIIALMLEVNPDLSPTEVKSILQNSCIADSFTGTVPNNTWGFGKLDALQVIQNTLQTVSTEDLPEISSGLKLFPNPASDQLMVELVNTKTEIIELKVYNMQGQGVTLPTNTVTNAAVIETEKLASGFYLVSITTNEGVMSQRFFKN
ncbi:MAG: S8/S53 family peptidase [Bacteroidota bacterium]